MVVLAASVHTRHAFWPTIRLHSASVVSILFIGSSFFIAPIPEILFASKIQQLVCDGMLFVANGNRIQKTFITNMHGYLD